MCEDIDILLMIDERDAVNPYIENLISALLEDAEALTEILDGFCNFHIGVTTTSVVPQNEEPCRALGSLVQPVAGCTAIAEDRVYVAKGDRIFPALGCLLTPTIPFDPETANSRPMDALIEALSPKANGPGGCNEGFFRPGAPLLVLLATDIDDTSSVQDPNFWVFSLITLQEGNNDNVVVAGFVPTGAADRTCGLAPADRLLEFAGLFPHSEITSICAEGPVLTDAYQNIFEALVPAACGGEG